jgi:hypothetical protein
MDYDDSDGAVTVADEGVPLVRYRARTDASKPHVDRLALSGDADGPSGRNLLVSAPHDHAWHRGCWFVQKLVDGVNCWESERHAANDRLHGRARDCGYAVTRSDGADRGESVAIDQDVRWETSDGDPLLDDSRRIGVVRPALTGLEDRGGYLLTWRQTLAATGSRRYLSSESYHGRYGGLSLRLSRELSGGEIRLPDETDPDPNADTPAPWCDYTGALDGRGRPGPWRAGVTVLTDAETGSVDWFTRAEPFALLCSNPVWREIATLNEGESITWSWALWVRGGRPDRETIERVSAAYREWAATEAV